MRAVTIGLLVVALAAAGGIAYLLNSFLTTKSAETAVPVEFVRVLVSNKALPAGATVDEASLEWHVWPDDNISENYISTTQDGAEFPVTVVGAIVRRSISAGEPIVAGKIFKRDAPGYLAGSLAAGKRAATINVDASSGISGFVFPGDHVDVLLTHDNVRDAFKQDTKNN